MAIAHMANDSKLKSAFRFGEIFHKIGNIGWKNLIKWYIINVIILMKISIIAVTITTNLLQFNPIISIDLILAILSLILAPYIYVP